MTSIGNLAFCGCDQLTSITFPDSVRSIGNYAFACINLTSAYYQGNVPIGFYDTPYFSTTVTSYYPAGNPTWEYQVKNGRWVYKGLGNYIGDAIPYLFDEIMYGVLTREEATIALSVIGYRGRDSNVIIPSTFESGGITYIVKEIGDEAFFGCMDLKEITILDTVTSIGDAAFANCRSLEKIDITPSVKKNGDSAFYKCEKLRFAYLPESCTDVGVYMFNYCSSLERVIIGNKVNDGFFMGCNNLREVYFLGDNPGISCEAFWASNYLEILNRMFDSTPQTNPELYIETIKKNTPILYHLRNRAGWYSPSYEESLDLVRNNSSWYIWSHCLNYTELKTSEANFEYDEGTIISYKGQSPVVVIPNSFENDPITEIRANTFANCSDIYVIIIPESVNMVGDKAFANCSDLKTVQVRGNAPEAAENIFEGDHCFVYYEKGTSGWKPVWNGVSVLSFDGDFIYEINDLQITITGYTGTAAYLEIPSEINGYPVTRIEEKAFFRSYDLLKIFIPKSVNSIGFGAFANCRKLQTVVFEGNTELDNSVFYDCQALSEVILSGGFEEISAYTFARCLGLRSIIIPDSVTYIGDSAFYKCKGLREIIVPDSVTGIGDGVFAWSNNLSIVVIGDNVEFMGDLVFAGCSSLNNVIIGSKVNFIGNNAFSGCSGLTRVYYKGDVPQGIYGVYWETSDTLISYYPEGYATWEAAIEGGQWQDRGVATWNPEPQPENVISFIPITEEGILTLTFTGTLEESDDAIHWTPVSDAKGTYDVDTTADQKKFYRFVK